MITSVPSNSCLKQMAAALAALCTPPYGLRLFSNPALDLDPSLLLTDFIEASYSGYARQSLVGQFPAPIKGADGQYVVRSSPFQFPLATTGAQTLYGWYIANASQWLVAGQFPQPLMANSLVGPNFSISLVLQQVL